jgi:hypothetical protein
LQNEQKLAEKRIEFNVCLNAPDLLGFLWVVGSVERNKLVAAQLLQLSVFGTHRVEWNDCSMILQCGIAMWYYIDCNVVLKSGVILIAMWCCIDCNVVIF